MKLRDYGLLADENIHPKVIAGLRADGLDIVSARDGELVGSADVGLLRWALKEHRAVVTHDADFGALAIPGKEPFLGIVYIRPGHIAPEFTLATFRTLLDQETELTEPFLIVAQRTHDRVKIRVRTV